MPEGVTVNTVEKKVIRFRHGGRVEITQSQCRVTQAWVTLDTPDAVVVGMDYNAKYCELLSMSSIVAHIGVGTNTLFVGCHPEKWTKVAFYGKRGRWNLSVQGGRYGWTFVLVRVRKATRCVYFNEVPAKK